MAGVSEVRQGPPFCNLSYGWFSNHASAQDTSAHLARKSYLHVLSFMSHILHLYTVTITYFFFLSFVFFVSSNEQDLLRLF